MESEFFPADEHLNFLGLQELLRCSAWMIFDYDQQQEDFTLYETSEISYR